MATSAPLVIGSDGHKRLLHPGDRLSQSLTLPASGRLTRKPTASCLDISPTPGVGTWAQVQQALALCNASAPTNTPDTITYPASGGSFKGGILATDGTIIMPPNNPAGLAEANYVGVFNPATNVLSKYVQNNGVVAPITGAGGVQVGDYVWFMGSRLSAFVSAYHITDNTTFLFNITPLNGQTTYTWSGMVYVGGYIWCIPCVFSTLSCLLKINPANPLSPVFNTYTSPGTSYDGGVLAPNGLIYCAPVNTTSVMKINPTANNYSLIGSIAAGQSFSGGVLAQNGCIYFMPYAGTTGVLKVDPATDAITLIGSLTTPSFSGAVVAPTGIIYGFGATNNSGFLRIDPATDTMTIIGTGSYGSLSGGCLAPNGNIYGVPNRGGGTAKITSGITDVPANLCLSPYLNKF